MDYKKEANSDEMVRAGEEVQRKTELERQRQTGKSTFYIRYDTIEEFNVD